MMTRQKIAFMKVNGPNVFTSHIHYIILYSLLSRSTPYIMLQIRFIMCNYLLIATGYNLITCLAVFSIIFTLTLKVYILDGPNGVACSPRAYFWKMGSAVSEIAYYFFGVKIYKQVCSRLAFTFK